MSGVLLSIRPRFVRSIFSLEKTIELRRVAPRLKSGSIGLVYEAAPTMALRGLVVIHDIEITSPNRLWPKVAEAAQLSRAEYRMYFKGARVAVALHLGRPFPLHTPIPLRELRRVSPEFSPPQSFRYISSLPSPLRSLIESAFIGLAGMEGPTVKRVLHGPGPR